MIDVKNPQQPRVIGKFPRPVPPDEAPYPQPRPAIHNLMRQQNPGLQDESALT